LELKLYRSALDEAFATIETAPTYLPLHVQIGDILLQMGNLPDAVTKFLIVAELYALRGETIHAINLLKRVLYLTPMEFKVHDRLTELLVAEGRVEETLQQTVAKADAYYHTAELDMTRQTYRDALRLAQQSKVDRSWSVKILYKIADIDLQSLDLRQALLVFEQIRTLEPEEAKARTQLVNLKFRLGQGSAALTEMDGFVALLEHGGKREAAIQFAKDLLEERPENLAISKRLADLYLRNGQLELGVKQLDSIAETLMAAGNREAAITVLNTIVALKPPNAAEYQAALDQLKSG
ncbi:MAG: tetratricopeptide repeat protein, partial [Anaerolineaceae bacterium]|nr:tetratricopeptide repeat protein [Anaerolineaceae bacterium]